MAKKYEITQAITTAASDSDSIRLFHGSQWEHTIDIAEFGVSADRAKGQGSTGDFWMWTDPEAVKAYAKLAPELGGPAVIGMDLTNEAVSKWLEQGVAERYLDGRYCFSPESHNELNTIRKNVEITRII